MRWQRDLQSNDVFQVHSEHAQPVLQSIAGDAAEGNELMNAWAQASCSEVIVEIVWNKIRGRTAVQSFRPLGCLGEGKTPKREDGSDPLPDFRVGLRFLPAAN